jgi:hypothetical protein
VGALPAGHHMSLGTTSYLPLPRVGALGYEINSREMYVKKPGVVYNRHYPRPYFCTAIGYPGELT